MFEAFLATVTGLTVVVLLRLALDLTTSYRRIRPLKLSNSSQDVLSLRNVQILHLNTKSLSDSRYEINLRVVVGNESSEHFRFWYDDGEKFIKDVKTLKRLM